MLRDSVSPFQPEHPEYPSPPPLGAFFSAATSARLSTASSPSPVRAASAVALSRISAIVVPGFNSTRRLSWVSESLANAWDDGVMTNALARISAQAGEVSVLFMCPRNDDRQY